MKILFGLQKYPGSVQGEAFCRFFRTEVLKIGHELVWLFRDVKPEGPGLFLDVRPFDVSDFERIDRLLVDKWEQRVAIRYGLSLEDAANLVLSIEFQYFQLLSSGCFGAYWAWNSSEPIAGIGRDVAQSLSLPVYSIETGLFRGNFRVDVTDFYDARNRLPDEIAAYRECGYEVIRRMLSEGLKIHRELRQSLNFSRLGGRSKSKLKVLFLDGISSDNGEFPFFDYADASLVYGVHGMGALARQAAQVSDLSIRLRPHPLTPRSAIKKLGYDERLCISRGALLDAIAESDLVVTGSSKSAYQSILSRKPTLILGKGFFYGMLASRIPERTDLKTFFSRYVGAYNPDSMIDALADIAGYLFNERWPTFGRADGLDGLSLHDCIKSTDIRVNDELDSCPYEGLLSNSFERLSDHAEVLKTQLRLSKGRKNMLRALLGW